MNRSTGLEAPLFALVVFAIFYQPILTRHMPGDPWLRLLMSPQAFFFVSVFVIMWVRKLSFRNLGIERKHLGKNLSLGTILGLIPVVSVFLLGALLTWIDDIYEFLPRPIFGGAPLWIPLAPPYLMTLFVLAPISEELFFRGILLKALRENYSALVSVLLSALIFMGGHGRIAPGPFVLGLINGVLMLRTGSVIPGIIFHVIANMYGPAMTTWFPNLYRYFYFLYE